jgi:quinol monooxygenase YgiN
LTLVVAGVVRVPPDKLASFRPHMEAMIRATREESGCLDYAYAEDVLDPGLIRVIEIWRDRAALDSHFGSGHIAEWRASWTQFGVSERRLIAYEVASQDHI